MRKYLVYDLVFILMWLALIIGLIVLWEGNLYHYQMIGYAPGIVDEQLARILFFLQTLVALGLLLVRALSVAAKKEEDS